MLAVTITTIVAEKVHPESIYTLKLVRKGIDISKERARDILVSIRVHEILGKETSSVLPSASIDDVMSVVEKEHRGTVTVVDGDGIFRGIITLDEIITTLRNMPALKNVVVAQDLAKDVLCLEESDDLKEAMGKFVQTESAVLPVVRKEGDKRRLVGIITKDDLLSAYRREASIRTGGFY
jgi:CIC family chloride channel protein